MSVQYTQFGIWVKRRLAETGLSVNDIAEEIGVSANYVSDILTGRTKGLKYLDQIVSFLSKKNEEALMEVV